MDILARDWSKKDARGEPNPGHYLGACMSQKKAEDGSASLRINVLDKTELTFWSRKLGVSKQVLVLTVKQVGDALSAVEHRLKR